MITHLFIWSPTLKVYFSSIDGPIYERCVSVAGFYTAAFDLQVEWLVVKGIANYADGSVNTNENWGKFASANAASLVAKILNDAVVFQRWPHYQGNDDHANKGRFVSLVNRMYYCIVWLVIAYEIRCKKV